MIARFFKILIITSLLAPVVALAQNDTVKDIENVDVYTQYRPVLSDAKRVESSPEMKDPVIKPINFTYSFPDLRYKVNPAFTSIAAQEYRTNTTSPINGNFIKAGFGNYTTPLLHLELHNAKNKNYAYGISGHHLSSTGKPAYKSFMDDNILLSGAKFINGNTLSGQLGYSRYGFNYYGYNHEQDTFEIDSVKQGISNITSNIHYDNIKTSKKLKTSFDFDFYRFSILQQNEIGYRISNKTGGKVGNGELYINTAFEGFTSGPDTARYNRQYIDINPVYKMRYKEVDLTMGLFASVFLDSMDDRFYLYPEFKVDYYVVPQKTKAYAGISGGLTKGSYRWLYNENAFLAEGQQLKNVYSPYIIFGGIKGKLGSSFDYFLEVSQQAINNLPLYLSDTLALHKFIIQYEDVGLLKFQAGLNYNRFEKFKIGTNFTYYSYNTNTTHAFQRPDFEWNTKISGTIRSKLNLHSKIYVIGNRYARYIYDDESTMLPIIADINIGADYRFSKDISFFIDLNNLTNQTYQRWFNYPVYGLNGIAGVTFIF
ncbi:MAG: TonB-dependent receptor [Bacteroidia bacterium]